VVSRWLKDFSDNRLPTTAYRFLVMRRSQLFATFSAAAFDNQLSALCRHASAEAVRLGATAIVRLKSPFHVYTSR
jgi:hypothetical protein